MCASRRNPRADGQFAHMRSFSTASSQDARVPNVDTLTSTVWLDLSTEPWVLSFPEIKDRYCVFSIFDGWTTVLPRRAPAQPAPNHRSTHHRTGLEGQAALGSEEAQVPNQPRLDARPYLLHGHL